MPELAWLGTATIVPSAARPKLLLLLPEVGLC